jgi:hypothetical protein
MISPCVAADEDDSTNVTTEADAPSERSKFANVWVCLPDIWWSGD